MTARAGPAACKRCREPEFRSLGYAVPLWFRSESIPASQAFCAMRFHLRRPSRPTVQDRPPAMNDRRGDSAWRALGALLACLPLTAALGAGRDGAYLAAREKADAPVPAAVAAYRADLRKALAANPPVLQLTVSDAPRRAAQRLALADGRFIEGTRDVVTGRGLRNEITGVYALRDSDIARPELQACRGNGACFRVELYAYAHNETRTAFVDVARARVLAVNRLVAMQPEISERQHTIALDLAAASPLVREQLGRSPTREEFLMANTRTSLARTKCELTQHLCVSPTLVDGSSALFVVVDLTDLRVVGVRWTKVGRVAVPSERRLHNESIARLYCDRATPVARNGWRFNFQITSSDGVRVGDVEFQGRTLFRSVKTVDWHVAYSWKDKLGYSDAVGCPVFSQAAVVAIDAPVFEAIREDGNDVGFALVQDFRSEQWPKPCNYFYRQRFEFFNDGRFRPWAAAYGRGCGEDGHYRPVTRIEFADMTQVAAHGADGWARWGEERWTRSRELQPSVERSKLRFRAGDGAEIDVRPNDGAPGAAQDGRICTSCHERTPPPRPEQPGSLGAPQTRGDDALLYVTLHPSGRDEGASDLPPIGTCCNADHRQGPEKFMTPPERLASDSAAPLVLWYVAQMQADARPGQQYCWADTVLQDGLYVAKAYPCYSGPMLIPRLPSPSASAPPR